MGLAGDSHQKLRARDKKTKGPGELFIKEGLRRTSPQDGHEERSISSEGGARKVQPTARLSKAWRSGPRPREYKWSWLSLRVTARIFRDLPKRGLHGEPKGAR